MAVEFVSYWSNVVSRPDDPEYAFAKKMMKHQKS
jgi:hypothetical protein